MRAFLENGGAFAGLQDSKRDPRVCRGVDMSREYYSSLGQCRRPGTPRPLLGETSC